MIFVSKSKILAIRNLFWLLVWTSLFLLLAYFALITLTVSDLVIFDKLQDHWQKTSALLAQLEERYLLLSGTISLNQARQLGFVEVKKTYFLRPGGQLLTASMNNADSRQ